MSQSMLGWWTCLCFCLGGGLWRNLTGIKRPIDVSRSEDRSCSGAGRSNLGCAALGMDFSQLLLGWWPLKDLYQSVWAHLRKNLVLELEGKPRQRSNLGCAAWGMDFSLLLYGWRALVDLSWLEINQRYFHLKCFVWNMNHSLAGSHLIWPEAFCFSQCKTLNAQCTSRQKAAYIRRNLPMVERVLKILKLKVISPHDSIRCQSWFFFEKIAFYCLKWSNACPI